MKPEDVQAIEAAWAVHASHRGRRSVAGIPIGKDYTFWKRGGRIQTDKLGELAGTMWNNARGNVKLYGLMVEQWVRQFGHLTYE